MSQTKTVQDLYAAFSRADIAGILTHLSDDVDWNNSGVESRECPWNGNFQGKSQVPEFFKAVGDQLEFAVFNPHTFIESGNHVAVLLRLESTLKKNGRPLKNDCVHVWTFNAGGQVSQYRHFNDTAQEVAAWRSSYTANLTPDKATGLGSWTEDMFIKALRTGKHQGEGRPILPPMPWQNFSQMTDADLKAVWAFLQTLPPVQNAVPDPVALPAPSK